MKLFIQVLSLFLFNKLLKAEKIGNVKLEGTKEGSLVPKVESNPKTSVHEDSSSTNNVIIKISENKKKTPSKKKTEAYMKSKKEKRMEKKVVDLTQSTPSVPESTYQVPTSNILFKDLEPKKIQITEKDYQELVESNKMMSKSMAEFHKSFNKNSNILNKLKALNSPEDDTKPRDLFNIKLIEVSDDVKPNK